MRSSSLSNFTLLSLDLTSTETTSPMLGGQKSVAIIGSLTVARRVSSFGSSTSATKVWLATEPSPL